MRIFRKSVKTKEKELRPYNFNYADELLTYKGIGNSKFQKRKHIPKDKCFDKYTPWATYITGICNTMTNKIDFIKYLTRELRYSKMLKEIFLNLILPLIVIAIEPIGTLLTIPQTDINAIPSGLLWSFILSSIITVFIISIVIFVVKNIMGINDEISFYQDIIQIVDKKENKQETQIDE